MRSGSFLRLAILLCMIAFAELSGLRQTISTKNENLHKLFKNHVLWNSYNGSVGECAVLCSTDTRCAAFTFLENSPESGQLCRGYSVCVAVLKQGDNEDIPAAAFYEVIGRKSPVDTTTFSDTDTWAETPCVSDSDCSQLQADTTCFDGTCVCTPGFFYSICSDTCVSECPPEKLAKSYTKYEDRYIEAHNDVNIYDISVEECFDLCTADPNCVSIDFGTNPLFCRMSYSVATSQGVTFVTSSTTNLVFDYYQRQCE